MCAEASSESVTQEIDTVVDRLATFTSTYRRAKATPSSSKRHMNHFNNHHTLTNLAHQNSPTSQVSASSFQNEENLLTYSTQHCWIVYQILPVTNR